MSEAVRRAKHCNPRICLFTDSFHPVIGGGEGQARLIARVLREQGNDIFVLTQHRINGSTQREVLDGVEVLRVGWPGYKRWGKYLMMPASLMKLVKTASRYDVIYVAGLRTLGVLGVTAAKLMGKRCLLRSANCTELSGDYIFESMDGGLLSRFMTPLLRGYLALRNAVLLRADGFLAMSRAIAGEYRAGGVDPRKIALIPNGVDLARYRPSDPADRAALRRRLGLPVRGMLVTYTGKLNRGKGLETLLRSWRQIAAVRMDVHLVLVGSGAYMYLSCEEELRAYARRHNMMNRVTFTGQQQNVQEFLQASDIYVMPSESEGLSNSLIEGLSCGLPSVVSAVGGMLDVATHDVNALLVPPKSEQALTDALLRLLGDEALRVRLAAAARNRAQIFDMRLTAERYERLFECLVCGKGLLCEA